jgi:outer membrane protein assembly factor BamB
MYLFCIHCNSPLFDSNTHSWFNTCPVCGQEETILFPAGCLHLPSCPVHAVLATTADDLWILVNSKLWKINGPNFTSLQPVPLPAGSYAGLAISGKTIILSTENSPGLLFGIDAQSSEIIWRVRNSAGFTPPTADQHLICTVDASGLIHALSPKTGKVCWTQSVSIGSLPYLNIEPVLSPELILLVPPTFNGNGLLALDRSNGRKRWQFNSPGDAKIQWAPIVVGGNAFLTAGDTLYKLDLASGDAVSWFKAQRKSTEGWFFKPPVSNGKQLFFLAAAMEGNRKVYALESVNIGDEGHRRLYVFRQHPRPAPAVWNHTLLLAERNAGLRLLDSVDGKEYQFLEYADGESLCPPQPLHDAVFVLNKDGMLNRFFTHLPAERLVGEPQTWQEMVVSTVLKNDLDKANTLLHEHVGLQASKQFASLCMPVGNKNKAMPKAKAPLKVFLSHASEDKPLVRKLCKRLQKDGFDPWLDDERLLPGMDWNLEIEESLRSSEAILLCISQLSIAKEGYIQREFKRAMQYMEEKPEGTIYLIPVRLDDCSMPYFIRELQWVDYPAGYEKLVASLNLRSEKILSIRTGKNKQ